MAFSTFDSGVFSVQRKLGFFMVKISHCPVFKTMAPRAIGDAFDFKLIVVYIVMASGTLGS